MAHGFQGIGKLPESKGYKDLHNWAWDKLKKAAKKVGETTDDITSKTEDRFDIIQSECLGKYCR